MDFRCWQSSLRCLFWHCVAHTKLHNFAEEWKMWAHLNLWVYLKNSEMVNIQNQNKSNKLIKLFYNILSVFLPYISLNKSLAIMWSIRCHKLYNQTNKQTVSCGIWASMFAHTETSWRHWRCQMLHKCWLSQHSFCWWETSSILCGVIPGSIKPRQPGLL